MPLTAPSPPAPSPTSASRRSVPRRGAHSHTPTRRSPTRQTSEAILANRPLGRYLDAEGRTRELFARAGHGGSVLVLDRDAATLCDRRLVAHLAADEPSGNVALVCRHYLEDPNGRWCRLLEPEDLELAPFAEGDAEGETDAQAEPEEREDELVDRHGNVYRLAPAPGEKSSALQLRWSRRSADARSAAWEQIGLRDVLAVLESYEPVRTLTARALARHRHDPLVSVTLLRSELERMCASRIVLNRGLREAVLEAMKTRELSLSEIAYRCGMVKRDKRGNHSGETSWLARRVGIMPEGGESAITPWVHSDVLGLIARRGLGISPRDVELG
jgi:hypothetical protein